MNRFIFVLSLVAAQCNAQEWYLGDWKTVDIDYGSIYSMTEAQARNWMGKKASYKPDLVSFDWANCASPHYVVEVLTDNDFGSNYRMDPAKLGITSERIEILNVGCPRRWAAPGSTLIKVSENTAYTLWDGAYLKLEKSNP